MRLAENEFDYRARGLRALALALLVTLAPAAPAAERALPLTNDWAADARWDDGLAEIAYYEASRVIYGAPRPYEAVLITVKEDFDADKLLKADPPLTGRSIVTVLKQNAVREIETPNYPYRIMTSTFVERADPSRLHKLTTTSHEWCGNTWQALRRDPDGLELAWSSYFDGEGDGRQRLDGGPGDLVLDQLPLTLRGLEFREGLRFEARLLPSLADTHGGPERWRRAVFHVTGKEVLRVPAGSIETWRVELTAEDNAGTLWFDVGNTHPLVRMETAGDRFSLRRIERRAYWRF